MTYRVNKYPASTSNEEKALIKYGEFILLVILSLLAGYNILKGVGNQDYFVYSRYYTSINIDNPLGKEIYFEYFYKIVASFSKLILHLNYEMFVSLLVFISLSIKFHLFSKRAYSLYLKMAYIIIMYLIYESIVLRAAFGISFIFLAFEYRDKRLLSLVFLLIGVFLHYSLIFMLPIWIFYKHFIDRNKAIMFLLLLLIGGILFYNLLLYSPLVSEYVDGRLMGYVTRSADYFNIWSLPKVFLLTILSYLLYTNIYTNDFRDKNKVMIFMFIGVFYFILAIIFFNISILYVRLVDIGILGYYLAATNPNFRDKSLIRFIFGLFIIYEILTRVLQMPYLVTHYL
jgi:hypothetical protein